MTQQEARRSDIWAITTTVNLGLVAWVVHLIALWGISHICDAEPFVMHVITLVTAVASIAGAAVGAGLWRSAHNRPDEHTHPGRSQFWGIIGVALNVYFLVIILAEGLPVLFLDPCT